MLQSQGRTAVDVCAFVLAHAHADGDIFLAAGRKSLACCRLRLQTRLLPPYSTAELHNSQNFLHVLLT